MTLDDIRADIDSIDARILSLLEKRMEKALLARRLKPAVEDKAREAVILERLRRTSRCLVRPDFSADLYGRIIAEAKAIQLADPLVAGFQGEHGAWSEIAARAWKPEAAALAFPDHDGIFEAVQRGWIDVGVVPVEESMGGAVGGGTRATALGAVFSRSDLDVVAAVDLPVEHCLLAPRGTDHRELRFAYSHPEALSQCRGFLERNRLEPKASRDSAGAARMLAEGFHPGAAAIASRFAAELYDLEIIKEGIQDPASCRVRFLAVARADNPRFSSDREEGDRCSAFFRLADLPGALAAVLSAFASGGINLTRVESFPDRPDAYAVLVDFAGDPRRAEVADALRRAEAASRDFRLLGRYRELRL